MNQFARLFSQLCSFVTECVAIALFFRKIPAKNDERRFRYGYLVLAALGLIIFMPDGFLNISSSAYSFGNYLNQLGRMLFHWIVTIGFLKAEKDIDLLNSIYYAGISTTIYLSLQNLRVTLIHLYRIHFPFGEMGNDIAVAFYILTRLSASWLIPQKIRMERTKRIPLNHPVMIFILGFLQIFLKWTLITVNEGQLSDPHFTNFLLSAALVTLCVSFIVVNNEINRSMQEDLNDLKMERMSDAYEMQNAKRALQTNKDIRRLYHDMKNHLLAIESMAGEKKEIQEYVKDLLPNIEGYESRVSTGNNTIDALLSEKIERGKLDHIEFNISLDLRNLDFMRAVDLITIFGNAVDNAIEALQKLPEDEKRIVYIKSNTFANSAVLRFTNRFNGTIRKQNGKLQTGKKDVNEHGIGLDSISHAVERYGGTLQYSYDNEERDFNLILMIPIQEHDEQ